MTQRNGKRRRTAVLESPLSATWTPRVRERAVLVGVGRGIDWSDLDELAALADSAGAEPVSRIVQTRSDPDPATFVGKGKLEEIHRTVYSTGADAVILDDELTPGQLRNLEGRLGTKVIDRTALILDIFALHARSREGKAQVELAQLNYLLPRLRGWGEAMSRLGGGIGTRGPGETKLEVDRQHIKRRISKLRRDIKDLARTRDVKRARREGSGIQQIAIAGYTNAGKSTLMNALTEAGVLVADQLFATLDPTIRRIALPGGRHATISDTVGFVSKLPHDLVEAFRSTLEEVTRADLVLHVADASSPEVEQQVEAVRSVLGEIGAGAIPEVLALNKVDVLSEMDRERATRRFPDAVALSALTGEGTEALLERVALEVPRPPVEVTLLVPYGRDEVIARLYRDAEVLGTEAGPEGTLVRARVGDRELATVGDYLVQPRRRRASSL
ncbi:MAG TPA: GTPase HflX [Actinomycetota bacterium]|nr:GTPase HflX [Actinomycetota bacterium]